MANILHVTHRYWPVPGGSERFVQAIAERQAEAGHRVTVLATNADDFSAFWDPKAKRIESPEDQYRGVRIIRTPIGYLPGKNWSFGLARWLQVRLGGMGSISVTLGRWLPNLPRLSEDLAALGNDWQVVTSWNVTFDGLMVAARNMAMRNRCQFMAFPLLHLGESSDSPIRRFYTMPHQLDLIRSADQVFVTTSLAKSYLIQAGIDEERLNVVGVGIDPIELSGGDRENFLQRHKIEKPIITFIGPLTRDKGTIYLVEAAQSLWEEGLTFNLVLAGRPMADFQAYWNKTNPIIKERTRLLGSIPEAEKLDLLAASDLLALPSRTDSFGIVLLEAWFYAKPVIGANAGGIPEVIEDGVDGRLVPFSDTLALSKAIAEILKDPDKANRWGVAGRRKTLSRYTWDDVYQRISTAAGIK